MKRYISKITSLLITLLVVASCEDFLANNGPRTELTKSAVFESDATANAAMLGVYNQMIFSGFASGGPNSATYLLSMSSDELTNYNKTASGLPVQEFNDNAIESTNPLVLSLWSETYQYIYKANAIMEGLSSSTRVTETLRSRLMGEAKFVRAFSHFYLVNLFGDVPIITSTDYKANSIVPRAPANEVYDQIQRDLIDAEELLPPDYSFSNNERVRATRSAASALLARVFLFRENWREAEARATSVITDPRYALEQDVNNVFLKNSNETILQLMPPSTQQNTLEANIFVFTGNPINAAISDLLINDFEIDDKRRQNWFGSTAGSGGTYYYPAKYKVVGGTDPLEEYSMVLRLAEQYLIRAESRLQQGKTSEAVDDLNAIRQRAGLDLLPNSLTTEEIRGAIQRERRLELFTEWGHRWLDLKRTNEIDAVLSPVKPDWQATDALLPIPFEQIQKDPAMAGAQNPGY